MENKQNELLKLRRNNKDLKNERFLLQQENKVLKEQIDKKDKEIYLLQLELSKLKEQNTLLISENSGLKSVYKNLQKYKGIAKNSSRVQVELNKRIKKLDDKYKSDIGNLKSIIRHREFRIQELESTLEFKNMELEKINNKNTTTLNTFEYSSIENNDYTNEDKKEYEQYIGVLKKADNISYNVVSLTGDVYKVEYYNEEDVVLDNGKPCKFTLTNSNKAYIIKTYMHNGRNLIKKEINSVKSHNRVNLNSNISFSGKKILLIGSRNKNRYTDILTKCNANITWLNPFESGLSRIDDECKKSDIVILMTGHCSHSAKYKIEKQKDFGIGYKYQFIYNDNVDNLTYRINYVIENIK